MAQEGRLSQARRKPLMIPREHGAYGQLLFPLVTALAVGRPGVAALALAGAAIAAFIAHEPLLVLLGQRGGRAARERRAEARRWFLGFAGAAVTLGVVALAALPRDARIAIILPLVLASALGVMIVRGREHTTPGEVVSALTLSSLALPIALAARASIGAALTCALVFAVAFVAATVCVRAMILWAQRRAGALPRSAAGAFAAGGVAVLAALSRADVTHAVGAWAALPVCGVGLWIVAVPPSPRHVRRVGWTLVGATVVTSALLIAGLRAPR
jgi:hypothetical protein